jgi:DNA anti-recombination protein RmuC
MVSAFTGSTFPLLPSLAVVALGSFVLVLGFGWMMGRSRRRLETSLREGLETSLREGLESTLRAELASELRLSRHELADSVARGQQDVAERFQRSLHDVQVSLGETEKRLGDVKTLGDSVTRLRDIFEQPSRRGRILGEMTLERLLADCLPPGYFAFQHPIGPLRVDAVVKFPHADVVIPIDSKFPESAEASVLLKCARDIATKYVRPDLGTTPYAYLYLPNESLWQEAVTQPKVWEQLVSLRVYPVSPHTLALALHGAAHGVSYFERAMRSREAVAELDARMGDLARLREKVSDGLASTRKSQIALSAVEEELARIEKRLAQRFAPSRGDDSAPDSPTPNFTYESPPDHAS